MNDTDWNRVPRALFVVMLMQFAVGGSILPFMSMWLQENGLSFASIGTIFSVASSTFLVFPFLWGMIADRYVPIQKVFTFLNVMTCLALFFMQTQTGFGGILISFLLFYSFYHPTFTLINALSFQYLANPREQFGFLRAFGSLGWMIPSAVIFAWLMKRNESSMHFVLYLGMAFALITAGCTLFLPQIKKIENEALSPNKPNYWKSVRLLFHNRDYVTLLVAFFLISGSFSYVVYYGPPYLLANGVSKAWIGPIQCIGVVLEIAMLPFLRHYIRRWGFVSALLIGCFSLVLRHLIYYYSTNPWILALSYLLAGMVIVFFHIGVSILVNMIAERSVRATAQTLLVVFGSGIGPMLANLVAGKLAEVYGNSLRPVFGFGTLLALVAFILIAWRAPHLRNIHGSDASA
ncbi:MFS transporter [bacterium]|nr:MFS transporter [bacterium]MDG1892102.1 MFS transporter [Verrucomicrobiota bacterium]